MSFTLEYFPADGSDSVKQSLAAWGFEKQWGGSFRSLVADSLTFTIKKTRAAILDTFQPRSLFIVRDGANNIIFQGVNQSDGKRRAGPNDSSVQFTLSGPWWWLEGLPFTRNITADFWTGGGVGFGTHEVINTEFSQFNLNRALDGTYMATRAMIIEILNFAIGKGAPFQYDASTIFDLAILPQPFQNGTCANALRAQLNDVDAIIGFDHSTTPPTLIIRQLSDCPSISRTMGALNQVIDWDLSRRDDLRVPYVQITFQGGTVVNGVDFPNPLTFVYPDPRPTGSLNNFYPLQATVPLNPLVVTSIGATIYTMEITGDLAWLKKVRPEYDPAVNPQAATDYAGLTVVAVARQGSLPRMFVPNQGSYDTWMGGHVQRETITVTIAYTKSVVGAFGNKVQHNISVPVYATDLLADGVDGVPLTNTQIKAIGESPAEFASLPQTIYESLNAICYEGTVKCIEPATQGWAQIGNVLNLLGDPAICRAEWNTMRALIHEINFETHGAVDKFFVTYVVGINKKLSTGQLRERIEAKRLLQPELTFIYSGGQISASNAAAFVPEQRAGNGITQGLPGYIESIVNSTPAGDGSSFIIRQSSSGNTTVPALTNSPILEIKKVDAAGVAVPNVPQASIALADMISTPTAVAKMRDWSGNGSGPFVFSTGVATTGGSVQLMQIVAVGGDFISCQGSNGTTSSGPVFKVAKPPQLRQSIATETLEGHVFNYTYFDSNTRLSDDGTESEYQVIVPRYTVGDVIYAVAAAPHSGVVDTPGVGATPTTFISLIEVMQVAPRVWARRYIQAST